MTFVVSEEKVKEVLRFLKTESNPRFLRLDDLTAIDESARRERGDFDIYNGTVGKEIGQGFPSAPESTGLSRLHHGLSFALL